MPSTSRRPAPVRHRTLEKDPNSKKGMQAERALVRYFERMAAHPPHLVCWLFGWTGRR